MKVTDTSSLLYGCLKEHHLPVIVDRASGLLVGSKQAVTLPVVRELLHSAMALDCPLVIELYTVDLARYDSLLSPMEANA